MIERIINWSLNNPALVIITTGIACILGWRAFQQTPIDAIPDLSDVQVIVKTHFPGQAPQVVEDQISRPLSSAMMSVPGAHTVRSFSFFGDSYVYVIFDDDTDIYWARSRVLEYLSQVSGKLPAGASPQLGPDASGVGWIYIYALQDKTGNYDLAQLRSLQDWLLSYELQAVPGVSEVAPVGGMIKQYQIQVEPQKLLAHGIPLNHIRNAIIRNNQETGASVIELAEAEYMLRATGYIKNAEMLRNISLGSNDQGTPLLLGNIARVLESPSPRRGVADLNGIGETVGGIVVMRHGENAQKTIAAIEKKLDSLKKSLPPGVEIVTVYNRATLIQRAVDNLWRKVVEELLLVGLVLFIFLFSARSVVVAMVTLPIGIFISFCIMHWQGINANIMSLGGIAIAIGAMVDGAIVLIENLHRKFSEQESHKTHRQIVFDSSKEVGPTLFFSLLIITVSFMPIFTLEAEEGKLFTPLALTKTYAMGAAALLSITLIPVLLFLLIRKPNQAKQNPFFIRAHSAYRSLLSQCLTHAPKVLFGCILLMIISLIPSQWIDEEFMPPLDEGDLMFMPTTHPGISIGKARELLQQTDKIIRTVPEVKNVFGKVGRADSATDPAPLTMIETFIQLKPREQWRKGLTTQDIIEELEEKVRIPGLTNAWVMPIKTRIDMLSTGMKTPLGLKLAGPDIDQLQALGAKLESLLGQLPDTRSVYAERSAGGRYLVIDIDRVAIARYALDIMEVQQWLQMAVGGMAISESIEGAERYPISLRFPDHYRDTPHQLERLPLLVQSGQQITLGDIAKLRIETGPPVLKSENARLNTWVFLDIGESEVSRYVAQAEHLIDREIDWPSGYSLRWAGQFESIQRVQEKMQFIIPLTLMIIALLLYLNFRRFSDVALLLATLPFALIGGMILILILDFKLSVAVTVGFIALAGLAVETGAIMLQVLRAPKLEQIPLDQWVCEQASQRLRPVLMTAAATIAGLLPILFGSEPGSEIMGRIAAPMVGGLITCVILTLLVIPTLFYWLQKNSVE